MENKNPNQSLHDETNTPTHITDHEKPTETQPPREISHGYITPTKQTPHLIPDSEIFDLESLFVMDTPDQVNAIKGKGILACRVPPPLFCYFDPPKGDVPELVYNALNVFQSWKKVDKLECMDSEKIRDILMHPCQDFRPFEEMKMMTNEGSVVPCHLPLLGDLYGMPDTFFILLAWEMEKLDEIKSPRFLPECLRNVIDPTPNLKLDGPVHDFGHEPVRIAMGTYTDAVHIMKLTTDNTNFTIRVVRSSVFVERDDGEQRPRRWYHEIAFIPHTVGPKSGSVPVEGNSTLVVWSGRGVARLSFVHNLNMIVEVYKPTVLVVVEARISQRNLVQLMEKVDGEYECGMFGSESFYGEVLIFWKIDGVELFAHKNFHKGCKADLTVKGASRSKVRKCLFMDDVSGPKTGDNGK